MTKPQRWWKWADASRTNRWVAIAGVVLLCYGTLLHIIQLLLFGVNFNGNLPAWAVVYFTALTLLDPLGAVLLAQARRSGLVFAVSILVTDSIANGWVNFVLDTSKGITVANGFTMPGWLDEPNRYGIEDGLWEPLWSESGVAVEDCPPLFLAGGILVAQEDFGMSVIASPYAGRTVCDMSDEEIEGGRH